MPSPITSLLDQARAAAAKQHLEQALAPLLRAWTQIRNPELAELIERLSDRLAQQRPPVAGSKRSEIEANWRERAGQADAIELGVLLPTLMAADSHQARKRLKLIARHAPDPRIASTLVGIVLRPPFTASSTAKFWQTLHELLRACPDPRALAQLEQAPLLTAGLSDPSSTLERLDGWRQRSIEGLRTQLEGLRTTLEPDDRARIEAIGAALDDAATAVHDPGPELLAAIVADPKDLDRRQVYADYLLGVGDPRGEFIALQLAEGRGELDRAGKSRANALLKQYGNAWLDKVGRALVRDRTRFVNGFLEVARIKQNHRGLTELLDDPVWATVETLELAPLVLIQSPMLRSLRSLTWTRYQLLNAARDQVSLPTIEQLSIEDQTWVRRTRRDREADEQLRTALEHEQLFPNLRRLTLDIHSELGLDELAWLWGGSLGERLESLELCMDREGGLGLASYLRSLRSARGQLGRLADVLITSRWMRCRFLRTEAGWSRIQLAPGPDAEPGELLTEMVLLGNIANLEVEIDPRIAHLRPDADQG